MLKKFLIIASLVVPITANAVIIDMGIITRDTSTGLDWLDVSETVDRSYDDISAKFGFGQEFSGWRYASASELGTLLINFGVPSDEINTSYGVDNEILLHVEVLIGSSFIDTEFNASFSQGIISDLYLGPETGGIAAHSTALISSSGTMIPNGGIRDDSGSFFIGSFLVTASPVPVPGAGWLFGSALIGLVGLKRQK